MNSPTLTPDQQTYEVDPSLRREIPVANGEVQAVNQAEIREQFVIPKTGETLTLGNFVPAPAAPYVQEAYRPNAAAELAKNTAEAELRYLTEVANAGGVATIRVVFLNSPDNQIRG